MIKAIRNILTVTIIFLVLILLPPGFWHSQFYGVSSSRFKLKDINFTQPDSLCVITNNFGNINIESWDKKNLLNLEGTVYSREKIEQPFTFGSKIKKHAAPYIVKKENILYIISKVSNQNIISLPFSSKHIDLSNWLIAPDINYADLNIKIADYSNLDYLISENGQIKVNLNTINLNAQTYSGDIELNGKIDTIYAQSVNGNILINQKDGSIIANTLNGNIIIYSNNLKKINYINSSYANIDLTLKALEKNSTIFIKSPNIKLNLPRTINTRINTNCDFQSNIEEFQNLKVTNDCELNLHRVNINLGKSDSQIWVDGKLFLNVE